MIAVFARAATSKELFKCWEIRVYPPGLSEKLALVLSLLDAQIVHASIKPHAAFVWEVIFEELHCGLSAPVGTRLGPFQRNVAIGAV